MSQKKILLFAIEGDLSPRQYECIIEKLNQALPPNYKAIILSKIKPMSKDEFVGYLEKILSMLKL